ncbi:MAG: exodeoxyribonuclease VII small subunit [Slackia sp.]|nr:exodeoxyribonuclease VII small subunit [Slackia sp.]
MDEQTRRSFTDIRDRLDEIANQVRGDDMPLDAALDLYDEAVKLGMKATELLETIEEGDHAESEEEAR